jgi:adenine-specific DNA-methyltransferase
MNQKLTGSFYTPEELVSYMVDYVRKKMRIDSVLEPSAGDGRFIRYLSNFGLKIDAIEIDKEKVSSLKEEYPNKVVLICDDYINYSINNSQKYDLIIGNPPYISKKSMSDEKRKLSCALIEYFQLPEALFQNLWVSFILGSVKMLNPNGAIFFVLPFEFLQVQYAEKLRGFLETKFNTIEIITFEEKVFEDIEQDVCLVYMSNEYHAKPYVKYTTVQNVKNMNIIFESVIMRNKPLKKWSNCIINDIETELLKRIAMQFPLIKDFGEISPGIVTGANSFFILNQKQLNIISESHLVPIIHKSSDLNGKLILTQEAFNEISKTNKTFLLNLNQLHESEFSSELKEYLQLGEKEKIHERYKCSSRKRWYDVPIVKSGDLSFFKRFNTLPRLLVNEPNIHTTDISYNIRLNNKYDKYSFAFCFYNSLTLALCEYNGRFYGGGVGELVPSEFKNTHIPYKEISVDKILKLNSMFLEKESYTQIIDFVDREVLALPEDQLEMLKEIRNKYLRRRLKKTDELLVKEATVNGGK